MDRHAWLPRSVDNQTAGQANITLLNLSGLKLKGTRSHPAKVVIWCEENETEGSIGPQSNDNSTHFLSCPMFIGNKRKASSWSCRWPDEARTLVTPIMNSNSGNCTITLYVGVQQKGQVQLLGYVNVTSQMPSLEQDATAEDIHPLQEMAHLSLPVEALKKVTRLGVGFKKSRSEYCISPSTMLKLQLRMTSEIENMSINVPTGLSDNDATPCVLDETLDSDESVISNKSVDRKNTLLESVSEPVQHLKREVPPGGSITDVTSLDGAHDDCSEGCTLESKRSLLDDSATNQMIVAPVGKESQSLPTDLLDMIHNPVVDNTQPSPGGTFAVNSKQVSLKEVQLSKNDQKPDEPKVNGDLNRIEPLQSAENTSIATSLAEENPAPDCQSVTSELALAEDHDVFVDIDLNKTVSGLSEYESVATEAATAGSDAASKQKNMCTLNPNDVPLGASRKSSLMDLETISDVSEASLAPYDDTVSPKFKELTPKDFNEPHIKKRPKKVTECTEWKLLQDMIGDMFEVWLSAICCCTPKDRMFCDDSTCMTSYTGCTGCTSYASLETDENDVSVFTV